MVEALKLIDRCCEPQEAALLLLAAFDHQISVAAMHAREIMCYYKKCKSAHDFWCEIVYLIERGG